jgi:catechol 2,3-dioxygenase-like lactoylglutathione lyase family enzyme
MTAIIGIQHIGLTVRNLEEALTWFAAIGFKEIFREGPMDIRTDHWVRALDVPLGAQMRNALIGNGCGCEIEVFQYDAPDASGQRPRNFDDGGHHLSFQVSDMTLALKQFRKAGVELLGSVNDNPDGPWEGADWIYLKTPFGLYIEVLQMPDQGIGYELAAGRRLYRPMPNPGN